MAFTYSTHRNQLEPELFALLLGILLLLLSFLIVEAFRPVTQPAPDSTVASREPLPVAPHAAAQSVGVTLGGATSGATTLKATVIVRPLENTLNTLLNQAGVSSEIPAGTKLLGVNVQENTVTVNLSKEFATGGGSTSVIGRVTELQNAVHGIYQNYRVKIAVEGKPLTILGGEGLEIQ